MYYNCKYQDYKADCIHTLPILILPSFRHFVRYKTARSQATKTEATLDATRASQIAFALSGVSFVSRYFNEFPTFSISAKMLVNIDERKVRESDADRGLPKCEIMYKAGMNNDSAI